MGPRKAVENALPRSARASPRRDWPAGWNAGARSGRAAV